MTTAVTTINLAELTNQVVARFAAELAQADDIRLERLARVAECMPCRTDLVPRMRGLVEEERSRRVIAAALRGWDATADRIERWEREGKVGTWRDPEYDVPDPRRRPGGEGGS